MRRRLVCPKKLHSLMKVTLQGNIFLHILYFPIERSTPGTSTPVSDFCSFYRHIGFVANYFNSWTSFVSPIENVLKAEYHHHISVTGGNVLPRLQTFKRKE
ncbi:hypothetical protein DPMN_144757 [Dreissena polymorpha]|uniref:Uncharacterized protein n=1 Tax=Dreissena polymorpha TaxID=45954 RepID=A0A9D4F2N9_DREPO|nr:hypothetical protein DPMN_144757 [Dreissena polymorpha]